MEDKTRARTQRENLILDNYKTHFVLGSDILNDEKKNEVKINLPKSTKSLSSLMKSTHFTLGTDKITIKSEANSKYVPHDLINSPIPGLDPAVNLRKTNYVLGSYKEPPKLAKIIQPVEKVESYMNSNLSSEHHYKLGTYNTSPTSTSKHEFTVKNLSSTDKNIYEKIKLKLQKSNIGLGHEPISFVSTKQDHFIKNQPAFNKFTSNMFESSLVFGSDKIKYESKPQEIQVKSPKAETPKQELIKDLRKAHFALGSQKCDYALSSQTLTGETPLLKSGNFLESVMRKSNLVLGDSHKVWRSSYKLAHSTSPVPVPQTVRNKDADKITNFVLGSVSPSPYVSVHRNDFRFFSPVKSVKNDHADYIRKHHYVLGTYKGTFKHNKVNNS